MDDSYPDWNDQYPLWIRENMRRLQLAARSVAHRLRNESLADVVFSEFLESVKQAPPSTAPQNPLGFAYRKMLWLAYDELKRRRSELGFRKQLKIVEPSQVRTNREAEMDARQQLLLFIDQSESVLHRLEEAFGIRRRDFRVRVEEMLRTYTADPAAFFDDTHGLHVKVFAEALGWEPNTFQKFRSRVDDALSTVPVKCPLTGQTRTLQCDDIFRLLYHLSDAVDVVG